MENVTNKDEVSKSELIETLDVALEYVCGDDGRAYFAKGHVDIASFMTALRKEVNSDDHILTETPEHCWMRYVRDFGDAQTLITEAKTGSRGAFKATWIQDNL